MEGTRFDWDVKKDKESMAFPLLWPSAHSLTRIVSLPRMSVTAVKRIDSIVSGR